jgi:hypothetical protein
MATLLEQLNDDLSRLSAQALASLVQIHNGRRGAGAG